MIKMKQIILLAGVLAVLLAGGCSKTESYSDLLRDEERACNWFLAQHRVEMEVPEDSVFLTGKDAPYYRMDEDGTVYMQVISAGDMENRPVEGDRIYFRFMRQNISTMYTEGTLNVAASGNMDNFNNALGSTSFFLGNTTYPNTTQYGTGIQIPMKYLGYNAEVNLVLKSYSGFVTESSTCIPYLLNLKYYQPEY